MAHCIVAVGVVGLRASLSLMDELRILCCLALCQKGNTSTYQPNYWLEVCGRFHLSFGV